ncbi:hypothetical protein HYW74_04875 [Candidatus Pacearchaeota archaeon]|nr:hypothetical protein [Candidatus Pacearchaeota archaeon]
MILPNKKSKKGMTLSIVLLVFFTLLVVGFAIFSFLTQKSDVDKTIYSVGFIGQMYDREEMINTYLQDIFDEAAKETSSEQEFIEKSKNLISAGKFPKDVFIIDENNKVYFPEYSSIITQINEDNIEIFYENNQPKRINIPLEITLRDQSNGKNKIYLTSEDDKPYKNQFSAAYTYRRVFESAI